MRFRNKTAIVTGAGSGIGRATSLRLASEGAFVFVADVQKEHGEETVKMIKEKEGKAQFVSCDVSRLDDLKNVVTLAQGVTGRLDIVVNNAAMMSFGLAVELAPEKWDQVINTNLRSVFLLSKFAIPLIQGGAIVNVSSVHAHETTPNNSAYAASKGGIEAFSRALSLETDPKKCRVNCVAPGAVNTPMLWNNPNVKSGKEKIQGRVGEPEDIAAAICFLASDEARFIHGTTLVADSGRLDIL
jgi:NAD(P)-dependent dehydrogenase (short-subunit alcohol dehydrogenase family)